MTAFESLARIRRFRLLALRLALRAEGGQLSSSSARSILRRYYGVSIGKHSYGGCFIPGAFPPNTTIGSFVSVACDVRAFTRNHPTDRLSMHPYFYNSKLPYLDEDTIEGNPLWIGADAWLGERAILTPGCARVGIGAVVGAGAVVTRDVPNFTIVAGNPARVIRRRWSDEVCDAVLESKWWLQPLERCVEAMPSMMRSLDSDTITTHPLLRRSLVHAQ